jgi:hypothetical protein
MSAKVAEIVQAMIDNDTVSVVAKMTNQELRKEYPNLTDEEQNLFLLNVRHLSIDVDYDIQRADGNLIKETLNEAEHQGLDGWTPEQMVVIRAFVADIAYAALHWN